MRRIAPIGAAALMLTLFTLAGGPGAVAHRDDDDRDPRSCRRWSECTAVLTTRTTTTVTGTRTTKVTVTEEGGTVSPGFRVLGTSWR